MRPSLQKYLLLVPLQFNDGTPVPESVILGLQEKLFALGGGFTIAGTVKGAYPSGRRVEANRRFAANLDWIARRPVCGSRKARRRVGNGPRAGNDVLGEDGRKHSLHSANVGEQFYGEASKAN
jgi:hypothetical protein